jgi:DNA repair exonuclease SbcCD ATPase subunit
VREIHAHNGLLITKYSRVQKKIYSINNVDARAKTLIIEHPITSGYTLIDTAKPLETTSSAYRFEIKLAANAATEFAVTEENIYDQQTSVMSMTPDAIVIWMRNKVLSDAARRQLQPIATLKTQIAANDNEKRNIDSQIQNITRDEERNRQNISSLSAVSGQQQVVQDYARKLADQEAQIAKLRDRQAELETQRTELQTQLNGLIEKLQF